jgi:YVTN family beta-propeller protein
MILLRGRTAAIAACLGVMASVALGASSAPTYRIVQSVPLGSPDRWDYVVYDGTSHRVFVSHGDRITVVDSVSGSVVGQVMGFPGGSHGIAVAAAAGRGYTDDGKAGTAASFDLTTLQVEKRLKADDDADALVFDPISAHVFIVDGDPGLLTVIDPKTDAVVATIKAGGKLEYAVSGNNGKLYVNGAEKQEIVRIDTKTNLVDAHWPMAGCVSPHGLAIDIENHRLFSSCANAVMVVMNSDNGAVITQLPIGQGTDAAAFDSRRKRAFSSNGRDGTLTVIQEKDANTFEVIDTVSTAVSGRTMDIDPESGRIFIAAAELDASAPPTNSAPGARRPTVPGSLKLLLLDPVR